MRLSASVFILIALLSSTLNSFGTERICLKSGFCLEADSHASTTDTLLLHVGSGTLEYAMQDIASIQALPSHVSKPASAPDTGSVPSVEPVELLARAAEQQGLASHTDFVLSVAKIESGWRQSAVSSKGALGLMQLMPGTAAKLGVDPRKASQNALGGAAYLRSLLIRYHGDSVLALAAYNAGPAAVDRFHGIPPYEETRRYVVKVLQEYQREHKLQQLTSSHRVVKSSLLASRFSHGQ